MLSAKKSINYSEGKKASIVKLIVPNNRKMFEYIIRFFLFNLPICMPTTSEVTRLETSKMAKIIPK